MRLCQDVYHCTPSELDEQDWKVVRTHVALLNARARVEGFKNRRKKSGGPLRGKRG